MTRDEAFEFLDRTARGIAEMFGSSCETLVHDMGVPSHPILSIYNGHVSGREVGSTMDILGIGLELDADSSVTDFVNLAATTPDGRQTKSSTFHMIGEDYNLALGINFSTAGAIAFQVGGIDISLSGLAIASLVGVILNAILPGNDYVFGQNSQGDTSVNFKV